MSCLSQLCVKWIWKSAYVCTWDGCVKIEWTALVWHLPRLLLHLWPSPNSVFFSVKVALESHLIFIIHKKCMYDFPWSAEISRMVLMALFDYYRPYSLYILPSAVIHSCCPLAQQSSTSKLVFFLSQGAVLHVNTPQNHKETNESPAFYTIQCKPWLYYFLSSVHLQDACSSEPSRVSSRRDKHPLLNSPVKAFRATNQNSPLKPFCLTAWCFGLLSYL